LTRQSETPLESYFFKKHVQRWSANNGDFEVIREHGHPLNQLLDQNTTLTILCGLPKGFHVQVGKDSRNFFKPFFQFIQRLRL
jgi:hypothetical protein